MADGILINTNNLNKNQHSQSSKKKIGRFELFKF